MPPLHRQSTVTIASKRATIDNFMKFPASAWNFEIYPYAQIFSKSAPARRDTQPHGAWISRIPLSGSSQRNYIIVFIQYVMEVSKSRNAGAEAELPLDRGRTVETIRARKTSVLCGKVRQGVTRELLPKSPFRHRLRQRPGKNKRRGRGPAVSVRRLSVGTQPAHLSAGCWSNSVHWPPLSSMM